MNDRGLVPLDRFISVEDIKAARQFAKSIIKNFDALSVDWVPDRLFFRDSELLDIEFSLMKAEEAGSAPESLMISGPTGTGKTVLVKFATSGKKFAGKVVYLNLMQQGLTTTNKFYAAVCRFFNPEYPTKGLSVADHMVFIEKQMEKERIPFLLVIADEIDAAKPDHISDILYPLLRNERFAVIAISNTQDPFESLNLDQRVISSFGHYHIYLNPYTVDQLFTIIKYRAEKALVPGFAPDEALWEIASIGGENGGDARLAVQLFSVSIKRAIRENARALSKRHVEEAFEIVMKEREKEIISKFPLIRKIVIASIYELMSQTGEKWVSSLNVYDKAFQYTKMFGFRKVHINTIRNELRTLELLRIIETNKKGRGRGQGIERRVRLTQQYIDIGRNVMETLKEAI